MISRLKLLLDESLGVFAKKAESPTHCSFKTPRNALLISTWELVSRWRYAIGFCYA